jgi:hypothetical protein
MKNWNKKMALGRAKRLFAIALSLLTIGSYQSVDAQPYHHSTAKVTVPTDPTPGNPWLDGLFGVRYSDGLTSNAYAPFSVIGGSPNCSKDFLLTMYIDDSLDVTMWNHLDGAYRSSNGWPAQMSYNLVIKKNGSAIYTLPNAFDPTTHIMEGDLYRFSFQPYGIGEYSLELTNTYAASSVTVGRVIVINRINKVSVVANEICATTYPTGSDYHFQVITDPPINSAIIGVSGWEPKYHTEFVVYPAAGLPNCQTKNDLVVNMYFNMSSGGLGAPTPVYNTDYLSGGWTYIGGAPMPNTGFGYAYNTWLGAGDKTNYTIKYADINDYFTNPFAAQNPIQGTVQIYDGITNYYAPVFIPVLAPATSANNNDNGAYAIYSYGVGASLFDGPFTITPPIAGAETWTPTSNPIVNAGYGINMPTLRVRDKIMISPGKTLTLQNMTIEMGPNAQILVQSDPAGVLPAGQLILNNSTIKAYNGCGNGNNTWAGIILQGNSNKDQLMMSGGGYHQGYLELNNSTISDAQVAVRTYDPTTAATVISRAGGVIHATNSTFSNNKGGIDFAAYPKRSMALFLTANPFAHWINQCTFSMDDAHSSGFRGFIAGNNINNVRVMSSSFTATVASGPTGFGIKGTDMDLRVYNAAGTTTPNTFTGLNEGISVNASAFGRPIVSVVSSSFSKNTTAIHSSAVNNPRFISNYFEVPEGGGTGVKIETGSGFAVTTNTFQNVTGSNPSPSGNQAVTVWNAGSSENAVQRNSVKNIQVGMLSNYMNRNATVPPTGLQFLCNTNISNVHFNAVVLGADPSQDGIRANQGDNTVAAGNIFSHSAMDFYNDGAGVGGVTYFYNAAPAAEPTSYSTSVIKNPITAADGCGGSIGTTVSTTTPIVHTLGALSGMSGSMLREGILDNVDYYNLHTELTDRSLQLHTYLGMLADPYSDLARVDLYIQDGDVTNANNLYNGIVQNRSLTGKEAYEFSHWGRMLFDISIDMLAADKAPTELSPTQVSTLSLVADNAVMWAKVRAQGWLNLYDGRTYSNTFLYPANLSTQRQLMTETPVSGNGVYPNPASNYIDVVYQVQNNQGIAPVLELRDVMGRIVLQQSLSNNATQRIAIDKLPIGVYLYRINEDGTTTMSGKLIKN